MTRFLLPLGLGLLGSLGCSPPPSSPAPHPHPVVVAIIVDQLAAWVAEERWPLLPESGGFARLRREGTYVHALRYEHAVTDTAPGHSALFTGAVPAVSGIFGNEVLGPDGVPQSILRDDGSHLLGSDGPLAQTGSSLAPLRVETVADRLRAEQPDALIVALSLKDRGALFGGGRHPTAALWHDVHDNRFVTSTAVAPFPAWASPFADEALARAEKSTWTLKDAAWVERNSVTPDAETGEGDLPGYGIVFPHALGQAKPPAIAFRMSPFADEVLLSLGLRALAAEHADAHARTTFLALSLSANDYVGHAFGPDSWEAWDELSHLDAALGTFLDGMDRLFGPDGYSVLLSADHGTNPMPEVGRHRYCDGADPWKRACDTAYRVMPHDLSESLKATAALALGPGDWITGVSDPYVYLSPAAIALDPTRRETLRAALRKALEALPGVAHVYDVDAIPTTCPPFADESVNALVCRSVAPAARARGAGYYLVLTPGSFFDPTFILGKGTSHGSPYLYDRTVPFVVRAPGRVAGGRGVDTATFDAFARTASDLLGIAPPHAAAGGASLTFQP